MRLAKLCALSIVVVVCLAGCPEDGTDSGMVGTDATMMGTDATMMGTDATMMGTDATIGTDSSLTMCTACMDCLTAVQAACATCPMDSDCDTPEDPCATAEALENMLGCMTCAATAGTTVCM